MKVLGQHILVEFYDCNKEVLSSPRLIQKHMENAALKSNATIVKSVFHHFNPFGVSGVVVIAESHLAIHTWPEYNYAAVDLFTCGTSVEPWAAFDHLKEHLESSDFKTRELKRGLPDLPGLMDVQLQHKPMDLSSQGPGQSCP